MSSNVENEGGAKSESGCESGKAQEVREAFASLPLDEKIATLLRVQFDMVGAAASTIVSEASKALDEIADAFAGKDESCDQPNTGEQAPQA